jgi:hypothetical protein
VADEFVLSASSVTTFLRCGRQWFFAYVAGVKSPPSLKAVRGIAVHKAVEVNMSQKINTAVDLPLEQVLDAYSDSWSDETSNGYRTDEGVKEGEIKDAGYDLLRVYQKRVAPKIVPAIVERPIRFKINGQDYTGQIDLGQIVPRNLHGEPEYALEIRDTKTTARKPKPEQYMLNMTGYAIAARQETGIPEADTVFDYLVATGTPYYHEVRMGGPINDDQIRSFASVIDDVGSNVRAGRFVPNGLVNGACSWCGFKDICPAYLKQNPNA